MTFDQLAALPELLPLVPRLLKAVETYKRIAADPDVKDAIAAVEEASAIMAKVQAQPVAQAPQDRGIEGL